MSKDESNAAETAKQIEEDEPDEWEQRIFSTGCADENAKLTDCYYEKKDWRACKDEMERFRQCWKQQKNDERTSMKDAEPEK
ncbi:hypothetical protein SPI_09249 [Niveomyces insectorum RCEF 264]|uniref:CHCH domain-containing protein n=1 Tax=Niveomyces insectorum RCEF 264 TaxID=1081102 RepID=A0A167M1P8_9HYPO|nr:hypothetical protein SPI_09249 [Niveomyces insectorum RCEF 264]